MTENCPDNCCNTITKNDFYKCDCGKDCECPLVEIALGGTGELSCCGKPMQKLVPKTADFKTEKHVPMIEKIPGGYKVTVGSTLHPMIDTHWIQIIELIVDNKLYRQYLDPGMEPVATFLVEGQNVSAREYCNIHGLWASN